MKEKQCKVKAGGLLWETCTRVKQILWWIFLDSLKLYTGDHFLSYLFVLIIQFLVLVLVLSSCSCECLWWGPPFTGYGFALTVGVERILDGHKILLLEAAPDKTFELPPHHSNRVSSITPGSREFLESKYCMNDSRIIQVSGRQFPAEPIKLKTPLRTQRRLQCTRNWFLPKKRRG